MPIDFNDFIELETFIAKHPREPDLDDATGERKYLQEMELFFVRHGYHDDLLHIQATDYTFLAAFGKLFKSTNDSSYYTEEQEQLKQRKLYMPRGKVLGGSSSINTMIYIRGNRYDYDHWSTLGNQGWSYAEILPYFKKAEHQERGASAYHGVGGLLNVADLRCVNPLTHAFVSAGVELGW